MKKCYKCNRLLSLENYHKSVSRKDGYHNKCKECCREYSIQNREHRTKLARSRYTTDVSRKNWHRSLKRMYGITHKEYEEMDINQHGKCLICGIHKDNTGRRLYVDHCHETKKIRGLLCSNCNTILGMSKDNIKVLKSAITYLEGSIDL